jgi:ssDNA-binding Zn-finger/Zn-ribbon topoisomerase 1
MQIKGGLLLNSATERKVNAGDIGELNISHILSNIKGNMFVLNNLLFNFQSIFPNASCQIDHLLVSDKWIYIIETKKNKFIRKYNINEEKYTVEYNEKNRNGLINPVFQNETHRKRLSKLLGLSGDNMICINIIICEQKNLLDNRTYKQSKFNNNFLVDVNYLISFIDQHEHSNHIAEFNKEKTISVINCINVSSQPYSLINHRNYTDFIKKFYDENSFTKIKADMIAKCPSCPGYLVIRRMNSVYKLGCSNYPSTKCGEIINLVDIDKYLIPDEEIETYDVNQDSELFMLKSMNQDLEMENVNLKQRLNNLQLQYKSVEQENSNKCIKIESLNYMLIKSQNDSNLIERKYNELKEEHYNFKKSLLYKIYNLIHKK